MACGLLLAAPSSMVNNFRFALRILSRNPGFTLAAILTLGAGIGANTAIFSAVDSLLLHPLPYRDSNQLVLITKNMPMFGLEKSDHSALDFLDYRSFSSSFSEMAAFTNNSTNLTGDAEPMRTFGLRASANLFEMLGVRPVLGRTFLPEEEQLGKDHVVVLGADLWRTRFGADRGILGKQIQLNLESFTVIGIVEPVLQFIETSQLYVPLALTPAELAPGSRGHQRFDVIARLKPGIDVERARGEFKVVAARMTTNLPDWYPKGWSVDAAPLADSVAGELRTPLLVLIAAVGIVLLIACTNVANLFLGRAMGRRKELAIRAALGAGRKQIVLQLLTESLVLAITAGAIGLLAAVWALNVFARFMPPGLMQGQQIAVNEITTAFTLGVSLLTCLLFGLAPAISASRTDLNEGLKAHARGVTGGSQRLRHSLAMAEVGLSMLLLVSAGLLLRSFLRIERLDPGFRAEHLLTARISLPQKQYTERSQISSFQSQLLDRIAALPGVTSTALVDGLPFGAGGSGGSFHILGRPWSESAGVPDVERRIASPQYLNTMRVPILQGRSFTHQDSANSARVAVIDESLARTYFPRGDAIGQSIRWFEDSYQIVGIVGAVKDRSFIAPPRPTIYYSSLQAPPPFFNLVVKTAGDPLALADGIQQQVRELDRNLPVYRIATMEQNLANSLLRRRIAMVLLAAFALFALALAAIGLYSVIAYGVGQRTPEIGIRVALGASRGDVQSMVLRQAIRPVLAGMAIGLIASIAVTRLMASLLYEVKSTDPLTLFCAAVAVLSVALVASYIPGRRAARIDPVEALREQ